MKIAGLEELAGRLSDPTHLLVWWKGGKFEVVAVKDEEWLDAFPLPGPVQEAAAEARMILDTTTAVRLQIEKMPSDFWEDLEEVRYGSHLRVSLLGRAGRKYLEVFQAVRTGSSGATMTLRSEELLQVTRWLREEGLFDHRSGDALMKVLAEFAK